MRPSRSPSKMIKYIRSLTYDELAYNTYTSSKVMKMNSSLNRKSFCPVY